MKNMNEVVQAQFGKLVMQLLEAEVVISQKDAKISELESGKSKKTIETEDDENGTTR